MKIHILGARGFIGKNLFEYLSSKYTTKGYSSSDCNLLDETSINEGLSKVSSEDIVIMASSITRLKENSLESMIKNIKMARNVGNFLYKNPVSQFVFLSTTDVYGINPILPINEKVFSNPYDYYAKSKISSEDIFESICSKREIPLLIFRLSGIYGKGDDGISTINRLVQSAKNNKKIIITGNDKITRDFVYVKDLCRLLDEGIKRNLTGVFNVATGKSYSIKEIAGMIRKNFLEEISVEYQVESNKQKRVGNMQFDISLLKRTFQNFKFTELKDGLQGYIQDT